MSQQAVDSSVESSIVVDVPIEKAFSVFTEGIGTWFPAEYNLLDVEIAERVFEPRVGGQIYDRGTDGTECRWARVLAYDPPNGVTFSWDISPRWEIESDPERTSEVEVRFVAETPERTRVELEHRHLDRHARAGSRSGSPSQAMEGGPVVYRSSRSASPPSRSGSALLGAAWEAHSGSIPGRRRSRRWRPGRRSEQSPRRGSTDSPRCRGGSRDGPFVRARGPCVPILDLAATRGHCVEPCARLESTRRVVAAQEV